MNQEYEVKELRPDLQQAIFDATDEMGSPTNIENHLASLGEPDSDKEPSETAALGSRTRLAFIAAAAITLLAGLALVFANADSGEPLEAASTAQPETSSNDTSDVTNNTEATLDPAQAPSQNPNEPDDDPNPLFDGTTGRLPITTNAVPDGFPNPMLTGLDAEQEVSVEDLKPSKSIRITEQDIAEDPTKAVIDGFDVEGTINVEANNVTIRNSRITASSTYVVRLHPGYSGLVIENTRIRAVGKVSVAVYLQGAATIDKVHVTGGSRNLEAVAGAKITSSYFTGTYRDEHSSQRNIQLTSGFDYDLSGNTVLGPWQSGSAAIRIDGEPAGVERISILNNYVSGGTYSINLTKAEVALADEQLSGTVVEPDSWKTGPLRNPSS